LASADHLGNLAHGEVAPKSRVHRFAPSPLSVCSTASHGASSSLLRAVIEAPLL
jgi:hypothetical protein